MQTEAVFENIAERIQQEINNAQNSIFIAVAWFTNKNIFNALVEKAKNGCAIKLIISNDHINLNSSIDFAQLNIKASKVFKIGDGDTKLMHNKFCVIDYCTVITGSYNWSYKAESNFENIVVTYDDTALAKQFISEFNAIRKGNYPDEIKKDETFPINKIIKWLEIIKNYILLEDIEELERVVPKLNEYSFNSVLEEIIISVNKHEFGDAVKRIQKFISNNRQIATWTDPQIAALKLEIKNLENQINAFDNERIDLEKLLSEFQHRHSIELGEIILDILKLRKIKFKNNQAKYEEAKKDEETYNEQFITEKDKEIVDLTLEEKVELKRKFRKSTVLCHPDKFTNEPLTVQKQAEIIFKELNEANAKNDLIKVTEILKNLEDGVLSTSKGDLLTDKDILKSTINRLHKKLKILESEITSIKQSETFKIILEIKDWDYYFENTKNKLRQELKDLQNNILKTM